MGGHLWWYVEPYEPDVAVVLQRVRQREFQAGRYSPVIPVPAFPVTAHSPAAGPDHDSIEDALEAADAQGTRTILDVPGLADSDDDWGMRPPDRETLLDLFGTTRPALAQVQASDRLTESLDRGESLYVVAYEGGQPAYLYFTGYSYD
ncbi:hypothetical protein CBQ26_17730 [Deinococcus indicus]|uniref:Uncharacterized protein n=1 Tax=Deinococcus indicus TaxID=223556 RepID=A0A246BFA9_9DEIO|nr:hypothetical protein [Deinococcus indicus]OWL93913.1 hypothetical protein CBQ26_17730 [Deinococcus indicus]GHG15767.1 hypothetical protein GCM10017784_03010 [Deinococcus indicus]